MQRKNLTTGAIRDAQCPPGRRDVILWDAKVRGLGLRVWAGGSKTYVFESRLNGRTVRVTIGAADAWPLESEEALDRETGERVRREGARQRAAALRAMVDQGIDPREHKAQKLAALEARREQARKGEAQALEAWDAYLLARATRWSPRTLLDHQRLSDPGGKPKTRGRKKGEGDTTRAGVLRPLLEQPLQAIDAAAVREFLQREKGRATQANNAFVRLRAFLRWCAEQDAYRGQVHADACASRMARDELPRRLPKQDALQREMLRPWFAAVRAVANPVHSAYLQALLLTGARREELAGLKWSDVDFQWRTLRLADKVDGERTIGLTPFVAELLRDLKRRNDTSPPEWRILHGRRIRNDLSSWKPSPWVFSSPTAASGRLQEPRVAHNRALKAAGLPDVTLHGLRRSFGSLSEWIEAPAGIVAQIMGHKPSALAEKHYRVRPVDLLRMWHGKIEAWMLAEAGLQQPAEDAQKPKAIGRRRAVGEGAQETG